MELPANSTAEATDTGAGAKTMDALRQSVSANFSMIMYIFRRWDLDGSGMVDRKEFWQALVGLLGSGCVTRMQSDELFDELDEDGSGEIDYNELHHRLRQGDAIDLGAEMQPGACGEIRGMRDSKQAISLREAGERQSLLQGLIITLDGEGPDVAAQLQQALTARYTRVIDLFREWDVDGDMTITQEEFRRALAPLGLDVAEQVCMALFSEFDCDLNGNISLSELDARLSIERRRQAVVLQAAARRRMGARIAEQKRLAEEQANRKPSRAPLAKNLKYGNFASRPKPGSTASTVNGVSATATARPPISTGNAPAVESSEKPTHTRPAFGKAQGSGRVENALQQENQRLRAEIEALHEQNARLRAGHGLGTGLLAPTPLPLEAGANPQQPRLLRGSQSNNPFRAADTHLPWYKTLLPQAPQEPIPEPALAATRLTPLALSIASPTAPSAVPSGRASPRAVKQSQAFPLISPMLTAPKAGGKQWRFRKGHTRVLERGKTAHFIVAASEVLQILAAKGDGKLFVSATNAAGEQVTSGTLVYDSASWHRGRMLTQLCAEIKAATPFWQGPGGHEFCFTYFPPHVFPTATMRVEFSIEMLFSPSEMLSAPES